MMILVPDAQFDDDASIERAIAGDDVAVTVHRERHADRIPDETWQAADALMVFHEIPVDEALLGRMPSLKIVVRAGVGFDQIDIAACARRGIPVCNVPDYGTAEVADHAIALMLGLARGLVSYHARLLADPNAGWGFQHGPLVRRLRGRRFGVVGLGRIGTAAARRARGMDMEVRFYDPHLPDGAEFGIGLHRCWTLAELLAESDVVSLHCPLSPETADLIDAAALAQMKPDALLINTARGGLVDLAALERALRGGRLAGAGLDVLPQEPPDGDHPLLQAFKRREPWIDGRVLITPHAAWYSEDGRREMREKAARTIVGLLREGALRNCVNAHLLGPRPQRPEDVAAVG